MSLHDLMPCAACGHPRRAHELVQTTDIFDQVAHVRVGCRDCTCDAWVEPTSSALASTDSRTKGGDDGIA